MEHFNIVVGKWHIECCDKKHNMTLWPGSHLKHMKHWTRKQYWNCVYWVWSLVRDLLEELFAEALCEMADYLTVSATYGHISPLLPRAIFSLPCVSSNFAAWIRTEKFGVGLHGSPPLTKWKYRHTTTWNTMCVYTFKKKKNIYICTIKYT